MHSSPASPARPELRQRRTTRALAVLITSAIVAGFAGGQARAIPPNPIDPPLEDVDIPFQAPPGGFQWQLDPRFGDKITSPDDAPSPAIVNYHYCSPDRPNTNCDFNDDQQSDGSASFYKYDPGYVHPTTLHARFYGCPTADEQNSNGDTALVYTWDVIDKTTGQPVAAGSTPRHSCYWETDLPIDPATGTGYPNTAVRLTITESEQSSTPLLTSPFIQDVTVRDYFIVSMGDSYGSGQGAPDVPQRLSEPAGVTLPIVEHGAVWQDRRCNRSANAASAQAAIRLERADPHSSVTFVSFACTGATINTNDNGTDWIFDPYAGRGEEKGSGVLGRYKGGDVVNRPEGDEFEYLPPQIDQLRDTVRLPDGSGSRTVDRLLLSGGGNDIGFGQIGAMCVLLLNCQDRSVTNADHSGQVTLRERMRQDFDALDGKYQLLNNALQGLVDQGMGLGKVVVTEYPDQTQNEHADNCGWILADALPTQSFALIATVLAPVTAVTAPLLIANGAIPPYGAYFSEVDFMHDFVFDEEDGLNAIIHHFADTHTTGDVQWESVHGIEEKFSGVTDGVGHGYCSNQSWIRNAGDATWIQGPVDWTAYLGINKTTLGTLHPNYTGWSAIADFMYPHLASLVPPTPTPVAQPVYMHSRDVNSIDNTQINPAGTVTATSPVSPSGWLTGCTPAGQVCPTGGGRAVAEMVIEAAPTTFVVSATATVNDVVVDCRTGAGLPAGATCQQGFLADQRLFKYSFQFANDGYYKLAFTGATDEGGVADFRRDLLVDLHDPATPFAIPTSEQPVTPSGYRGPVTVGFDVLPGSDLSDVEGISVIVDGSQPQIILPKSKLSAGLTDAADIVVRSNGSHTVQYNTFDRAGRTSPVQTIGFTINTTPTSGPVASWGYNNYGQLGDGTRVNHSLPAPVAGLDDAVQIAARSDWAIALKANGAVVGWGHNFGAFGSLSTPWVTTPIQIGGFGPGSGIVEVALGTNHILALKNDGTVYAWGADDYGQRGDGPGGASNAGTVPQVIFPAGSGITHLAAGTSFSLAVTADGTVYGWGRNWEGQVGDGTQTHRNAPVVVVPAATNSRVVNVSAGYDHSLAVRQDGTVLGWGYNTSGVLIPGAPSYVTTPTAVPQATKIVEVEAGLHFSLARREDGIVLGWGSNATGQLVNLPSYGPPRPLPGVGGATSITAGDQFALAVRFDGSVKAWGDNVYGQIGNGVTGAIAPVTTVQLASGLAGRPLVAAGQYFSVVLTNARPTAAIAGPATAEVGVPVTFDASASSDADGSIPSYRWSFADSPSLFGATTTYTFTAAGTYTVSLLVTDDDGATAQATHTIVVSNPNVTPVAGFTAADTTGPGKAVDFDATTSDDPDGSIVSYSWNFGDGSTGSGVLAQHAYTSAGDYTVELTVTDDRGATATATRAVHVIAPNAAPVASFTHTPEPATAGETVFFDGSASSDADGTVVSYAWDFGDGTDGVGVTAGRVFAEPGAYTVTLIVTDNSGKTGATTAVVHVEAPVPNVPPTAAFTTSQADAEVPTLVFDASGSVDPDSPITNYFWDFDDGTYGVGPVVTHTYSADKWAYHPRLTVTDSRGATASISHLVRPYIVHVTINDDSIVEGSDTSANWGWIVVSLDRVVSEPITITRTLVAGTATYGVDFTDPVRPISATVVIPEFTASTAVPFDPSGDTTIEPNETFSVSIASTSPNVRVVDATGTYTIEDDDYISVRIDDQSQVEGPKGTNTAGQLRITTDRPVPQAVTVAVNREAGTATYSSDFTVGGTLPRNVTIPKGSSGVTISWTAKGDNIPEPNETFGIHIATSSPIARVVDADATVTIVNDDGAPVQVSIQDASVSEGNRSAGTTGTVQIVADRVSPIPVSVQVTLLPGTAVETIDYRVGKVLPATVTIPAGASSVSFSWRSVGDAVREGNETFGLHVATSTDGATIADADATFTIVDDD